MGPPPQQRLLRRAGPPGGFKSLNAENAENAENNSKRVLFQESERRFLCVLRVETFRFSVPPCLRPSVPFFHILPPLARKLCTTAHRNTSMTKPSNSCQNRSFGARKPSKSDQNRAQFVMPILTFAGLTPSGASARPVLGGPKGQKGRFSSAKNALKKLSTVPRKKKGNKNPESAI
jgi:hypothetical protein